MTGQPSSLCELLTPEEAAERLAIGRTTLYGLLKSGELGSVRIGRLRRIPVLEIRAYLAHLTSH